MSSWTAVSRPPYFTALALWPKNNTYGGGGIFESRTKILLDRQEWEEIQVAEGFSIPNWLSIELLVVAAAGKILTCRHPGRSVFKKVVGN